MIKPHQILQGVIDGECTFVQFPKGSDKYHLFSSTSTFGSGSIQTQVFFSEHTSILISLFTQQKFEMASQFGVMDLLTTSTTIK